MGRRARIFVTAIGTETHQFNRIPTTLEAFTRKGFVFLEEHGSFEPFRTGDNFLGGYLDVADAQNWDLVAGVCAWALPAGPVTEEAFETLWSRIERQLKDEGPFDGLLLPLHGAMACEHLDDPEGDFVARLRRIVGRETPIAVSLDLHGNLSPSFVRSCDIVCGFHTTPHTDMRETSFRAANLLARTLRGEIRPESHSIHPPMLKGLDNGRTISPSAPINRLLRRAREIMQADPQVLDATFMAGFAFSDRPWTGPSAVLVMNGPSARVTSYLEEFGAEIWRTRDVFTMPVVTIDEALDAVEATEGDDKPFLLGDFSDCPLAGGYGDSTAILSALLERGISKAVFGPVFDPNAAAMAHEAGLGSALSLSIGGRCDPRYGGGPISCTAYVKALSDGRFVHKGPFFHGQEGTLGTCALLTVSGVDVLIASIPGQIHDREQLRILGLVPEELNLIVSKSINHMRADLEPISRGLLYPDGGGIVSYNFKQFPFTKVRRPIWPLDEFELVHGDMTLS